VFRIQAQILDMPTRWETILFIRTAAIQPPNIRAGVPRHSGEIFTVKHLVYVDTYSGSEAPSIY
jgi:hypothetical protein